MTVGTTDVSLSTLPASISQIIQSGLLIGEFEDALAVTYNYPQAFEKIYTPRGNGEEFTQTRDAILAPVQDPITPTNTGLDSGLTVSTVGREQWTFTMNKYADTIDTTEDEDLLAFGKLFVSNVKALGAGAGRTVNLQARRRLTYAFAGGRTHATNAATVGTTSITVANANGFDETYTNGVAGTVSASNTLTITVNGTSNTVTAATGFTRTDASDMVSGTLTLGTSTTWSIGDAVIAASAPFSRRPNARTTSYDLTSTDLLTYQDIVDTKAALVNSGVLPFTPDGLYLFMGDAQHEANLHADTVFQNAIQGQYQSEQFKYGKAIVAGGVVFIFGNEPPNSTSWGASSITVRRAFVLGAQNSAMACYNFNQTDTDSSFNVTPIHAIFRDPEMGLKLVFRPALDRLAQIISTSYEVVADWVVSTDSLSSLGDVPNAVYKRGALIETA